MKSVVYGRSHKAVNGWQRQMGVRDGGRSAGYDGDVGHGDRPPLFPGALGEVEVPAAAIGRTSC